MAIKKPLVLAAGQIQELQSGDDIDPQVRVSATDTIPNYLSSKIVGGAGIDATVVSYPGGNEELEIALSSPGDIYLVQVSSDDSDPSYLETKLVAGTGISLTVNNPGAIETLTIAATGGGSSAPDIHPFLLMGA
jgi:hypothetical protein